MGNAMQKMLRMLMKGRVPEADDLKLGKEEFVALVSEADEKGYIEGVYISFCDRESIAGLLSSARITEKGIEAAKRKWF